MRNNEKNNNVSSIQFYVSTNYQHTYTRKKTSKMKINKFQILCFLKTITKAPLSVFKHLPFHLEKGQQQISTVKQHLSSIKYALPGIKREMD